MDSFPPEYTASCAIVAACCKGSQSLLYSVFKQLTAMLPFPALRQLTGRRR